MVSYCCVKGCKNNSRSKRKNPNSNITFHALPANPDLRAKWLKAIGRPNWEPSLHMRLCSVHFDNNQISREGHRTRIKDDACPTRFLPVNSNFEASFLEVCRICLATDIKMYSLQDGILKLCIGNIYRMIEDIHIEGMPQFVCYECGACLIRFYYLMEKSMITQSTLLDIFAHNGEISMDLIKKQDRKQLNLNSSLGYYKTTHIYKYTYHCDDKSSVFIKRDDTNVIDDNRDDVFKTNDNEFQIKNAFINKTWDDSLKADVVKKIENVDSKTFNDITKINCDNQTDLKDNISLVNEMDCISEGDDFLDDYDSHAAITEINNEKKIDTPNKLERRETMKNKLEKINGLTRSEVNMQEHFDIVKLSLQEQVEEWRKARVNRTLTSEIIFKCEICLRIFAHVQPYRNHIAGHNPDRGKEECPVCKLRFKDKLHVQSHRRRIHGNKFYCKKCPKVFSNIAVARKHYRWHSGHRYKCGWCSFTSAHESAVGAHARTSHAHASGAYACAHCGVPCRSARGLSLHSSIAHKHQTEIEISREHKCESCNIYFASEGARRVHLLTSRHNKTSLCDTTTNDITLNNACDKCGVDFSSPIKLKAHIEAEHQNGVRRKYSWRKPGDCYPILCEHCGETLTSRRVHYWHVRRQHPKQKHLYQPIITAVCEICGKGFQNSTKLHLHELRHGQPTVKCVHCPRLFYDKYAAAIHGAVHEPAKPHACPTCGRTFKLKGNLHRHSKVHSSVAPYECSMCGKKFKYSYSVNLHVRTVHYKMPHPPRKKRKVARNNSHSPDSDNINI